MNPVQLEFWIHQRFFDTVLSLWSINGKTTCLSWPCFLFLQVFGEFGDYVLPSLAQMVKNGKEIPEPSELSQKLKAMAVEVLEAGTPILNQKHIDHGRYFITDLVVDIREPRNIHELLATGTQLYPLLADFFLRAKGLRSAKGKTIPCVLEKTDADFSKKYNDAFEALLRDANPKSVIAFVGEILKPYGGFLFDGFRFDAPVLKPKIS